MKTTASWLGTLFVGVAMNMIAQAPGPAPARAHANLAKGIRELGSQFKYIILAEEDHSSPDIKEAEADPEVIAAMRAIGPVAVIEAHVSQNQGMDPVRVKEDAEKIKQTIATIQKFFIVEGFGSVKEQDTIYHVISEALPAYIAMLKQHQYWGWEKDKTVFYSDEFLDHLAEKTNRLRGNDQNAVVVNNMSAFLDALRYLKDTGNAPVPVTLRYRYDMLCHGLQTVDQFAAEMPSQYRVANPEESKRRSRAEITMLAHACADGLEFYYADPGIPEIAADPETEEFFLHISGISGGNTIQDLINSRIYADAELNANVKFRKHALTMQKMLGERVSDKLNRQVVDNAENVIGKNPAVYIYGSSHADALQTILGADQTVVIGLFAQPESQKFGSKQDKRPAAFYDAAADRFVALGNRASDKAYAAKIKYSISRDEYKKAVAALPVELRFYAFDYSQYDTNQKNNKIPDNWLETDVVYH